MAKVRVNFILDVEETVIPRIVQAIRSGHPEWAALTDQLTVREWLKQRIISVVATQESELAKADAEALAASAAQARQARIQAILTEGATAIDAVP